MKRYTAIVAGEMPAGAHAESVLAPATRSSSSPPTGLPLVPTPSTRYVPLQDVGLGYSVRGYSVGTQ